jgi:PAS domain S-box-containing protein
MGTNNPEKRPDPRDGAALRPESPHQGKPERALAASQEQFRLLVSGVQDYAIFMLDPGGHIVTWNVGAERIKGYQAEEIIGRHFSVFYPPEDLARGKTEHELEVANRTGKYEEEGWRLRKDGSRFWASVVITALRDQTGELRGFGKVTRDLTERRKSEGELRAHEERFRLLVSGVRDYAIFMLDPGGHIVTWNAGAERIKGYQAEEIIGRHFSVFYPPEDLAAGKTERELEVATRTGKYEEEGWRLRKDGSRFWASVVITALRGNDGALFGFSKVTRDITERRESDRIRSIVDNVVDGIVTFDENGIVESLNPAAERIFGYRADEVLGRSVRLLAAPGDPTDWAAQARPDAGSRETLGRRKDGAEFPMDLAVGGFHFQGRRAYTAVVRDITERRQAEEQLVFYAHELQEKNADLARSNQELDDFAYVASHDLKEPLRGIHNYAKFLLEDHGLQLAGDGRDKLETLTRLAQRMEALIDSLLQFSRVGRLALAHQDADLNDVVGSALEALQITLKEERVEVRIPERLPIVRCDRVRVREVFHNLITNAVKYNDKPNKWVEVGARGGGGGPVAFYVRDNGIGIPAKHHDAVFRIFKRLHGRNKFGGGTGAGLTIVKKIVERHGGRIWVESAVGEGTTFFFTLAPEDA